MDFRAAFGLPLALVLTGCQQLLHVPVQVPGVMSEDSARTTFEQGLRAQSQYTGETIASFAWRTAWVDVSMTRGRGERLIRIPLENAIQQIQYDPPDCRVWLPIKVLQSRDWPRETWPGQLMLYTSGGKKCEARLRPTCDAFNELVARNAPMRDPAADPDFQRRLEAWRASGGKLELPDEARREKVLAENSYREKDLEGAVEHYSRALRIEPAWPDGNFNAALISAELGDFPGAIRWMKRYLALVPSGRDSDAARDKIIVWEDKAKRAP